MKIPWQMRVALKRAYLRSRKTLLSIFSLLLPSKNRKTIPVHPKNILVISQLRIGDAVLCIPVIRVLRKKFPESKICVLANPYTSEIYDMLQEVDQLIEYSRNRKWFKSLDSLRVTRKIRQEKIDLLMDLSTDGRLEFAVISWLSNAGYSMGYDQDGRGCLFDYSLPFPEEKTHFVDLLLNMLNPSQIFSNDKMPSLRVPDKEHNEMKELLMSMGMMSSDLLIGLHPGATHPTQRWPLEYFADLADKIISSSQGKLILCGGLNDQEDLERITKQMHKTPHILPPLPSVKQLTAFLAECSLFICNNSGPLHLAAAVQTVTLSFMGPTKAAQWWPLGNNHIVLRRDELPCIGCNLGYCKIRTHDCMRLIQPGEAFEAVKTKMSWAQKNCTNSFCVF